MASAVHAAGTLADHVREQAAEHTLAANPLVGVRRQDILNSARMLLGKMLNNPAVATREYLSLLGELGRIGLADRSLRPTPRISVSPIRHGRGASLRALAQCYLAWGGALNRFVDKAQMDKRDAERARFVISLLVDAMSPTNWLGANPTALKSWSILAAQASCMAWKILSVTLPPTAACRPRSTRGTSPSARTWRQRRDRSLPDPVMELIQYRPMTDEVHARPLLIAPPQINKFYVFDLVPQKSIIQFALKGGLQPFAISWKNPTSAQSHFGLDTYVGGARGGRRRDARDHRQRGRQYLGLVLRRHHHLGLPRPSRRPRRAEGPQRHRGGLRAGYGGDGELHGRNLCHPGNPSSRQRAPRSHRRARRPGTGAHVRLDAPNDLIWSYWVNNYLLGNAPPAFDILYWNNDTTRLPAHSCMPIFSISSAPILMSMRDGCRCAARRST